MAKKKPGGDTGLFHYLGARHSAGRLSAIDNFLPPAARSAK
jgi:hypothetical protein